MSNTRPTAVVVPKGLRASNLRPIVLSDGAVLELEHHALIAPECPECEPLFARDVVVDDAGTPVHHDARRDDNPLM